MDQETDVSRKILTAAVRVFARKGYDGASVREIAGAAGVTKPTLYYYFGSKEGLGHAIVKDAHERLDGYLKEWTGGSRDVIEKLVGFVYAHFVGCREDRELASFLYGLSFAPEESKLRLDVEGFRKNAFRLLKEILGEAMRQGVIREGAGDDAELILMGITNIHLMGFLKLGQELTRERAERVVRFFLEGVGVDRREGAAE